MAFARFSKPATSTPAAQPTAAGQPNAGPLSDVNPPAREVKAEIVRTTPPPATTTPPATTPAAAQPRALLIPKISTKSVLATIARAAEEETGVAELFPTLVVVGGNAGGTVAPSSLTPKEVADLLPQGKQTIRAVFMAFRSGVISWPRDKESSEAGTKPVFEAAIPANDPETTEALRKAAHNFQVASKDVKTAKWSVDGGGPGYIRPIFEMLVYLPAFDDVVVLRCAPLLRTWGQMATELGAFKDGNGDLSAFTGAFEITSAPWYDDNLFHYFKVSPWTGADGMAAAKKYDEFIANVVEHRPDLAQSINDWFTCADKPLSESARAKLVQGSNMVNPRRARG